MVDPTSVVANDKPSRTEEEMDERQPLHAPNPLETAGIWSQLYFLWAYPLVRLGKKQPLEDKDLSALSTIDSSVYGRDHVWELWEMEKRRCATKGKTPSLARALYWDYWKRTSGARCYLLGNMVSRLLQSVALGRILRELDSDSSSSSSSSRLNGNEVYLWAALLVACGLVSFPTKQQQFFQTYRVG